MSEGRGARSQHPHPTRAFLRQAAELGGWGGAPLHSVTPGAKGDTVPAARWVSWGQEEVWRARGQGAGARGERVFANVARACVRCGAPGCVRACPRGWVCAGTRVCGRAARGSRGGQPSVPPGANLVRGTEPQGSSRNLRDPDWQGKELRAKDFGSGGDPLHHAPLPRERCFFGRTVPVREKLISSSWMSLQEY